MCKGEEKKKKREKEKANVKRAAGLSGVTTNEKSRVFFCVLDRWFKYMGPGKLNE